MNSPKSASVKEASVRQFMLQLLSGDGISRESYEVLKKFLENFNPLWYGDILMLIQDESEKIHLEEKDIELLKSL
jgi:hypothetical protein